MFHKLRISLAIDWNLPTQGSGMLMDKAGPSRWPPTKGNDAQRPTLNAECSIQNGRLERCALDVERWALKELRTGFQNVAQRPVRCTRRLQSHLSFLLLASVITMIWTNASAT